MAADVTRYEHTVGRYMLFGAIGAGGMATVHIGRRVGAAGFARLVAIKRLHPHLAVDREVVHAFLDEARIAARVTHANVVSIHDVVLDGNEVLLVMEYVAGRALSLLASAERTAGRAIPPSIAGAIAIDLLRGLQAAHEARDERGRLLGVIHRDVSPHNVLVGVDGVARVLDFGIAKALGRMQTTADGAVKGKLAYMAPERMLGQEATARVDVYAAAIVVWEMLAGKRYFDGPADETMIPRVIAPTYRHLEGASLVAADAVLERALRRDPSERHATASELASSLQGALRIAPHDEVAAWVQQVAGAELTASAEAIEEIEQLSVPSPAPLSRETAREVSVPPARSSTPNTGSAVVSNAQPPLEAKPRRTPKRLVAVLLASLGVLLVLVVAAVAASRGSRVLAGARAAPAVEPPASATTATVSAEPELPVTPPLPAAAASVAVTKHAPVVLPGRRAPAAPASATTLPVTAPKASAEPPAPLPEAPTDRT